MNVSQELFCPDIEFGTHEDFFGKCTIPNLGGKVFAYCPQTNLPDSVYLDSGVTHLHINPGTDRTRVPYAQRSTFMGNPGIFHDIRPDKPVPDWDDNDCLAGAQAIMAGGPWNIYTSGTAEAYGGVEPWAQLHQYWQSEKIDRYLKQLDPNGLNCGQYDGHLNFNGYTGGFANWNGVRAGYASNAAALDVAKQSTGFGNGFFSANKCSFMDGLINVYGNGSTDYFYTMLINVIMFEINNMALAQAVANNNNVYQPKVLAFGWAGSEQLLGANGALVSHRVPVRNGYTTDFGFPHYAPRYQAILAFASLLYLKGIFLWEDTMHPGKDNTLIQTGPTYHQTSSGPGVTIKEARAYYQPDGAGMPNSPKGGTSGMPIGAKLYGDCIAWAGSQDWTYVRSRPVGGSYCSNNKTFALDRMDDRAPLAWRIGAGNQCALVVWANQAGSYGEYEFDMGGGQTVTRPIFGTTPHAFLCQ